jgi:hypothetical protein
MTLPERNLLRARACFAASTVLFVVFCLLGGGNWDRWMSAGWAEGLRISSLLAGIFAWSLLCTAYGLRRKAL